MVPAPDEHGDVTPGALENNPKAFPSWTFSGTGSELAAANFGAGLGRTGLGVISTPTPPLLALPAEADGWIGTSSPLSLSTSLSDSLDSSVVATDVSSEESLRLPLRRGASGGTSMPALTMSLLRTKDLGLCGRLAARLNSVNKRLRLQACPHKVAPWPSDVGLSNLNNWDLTKFVGVTCIYQT